METTTYTFTPTSGECITTTTVTITIGEETTPTFPGIVTAYCAGTSFTLPTISYEGIEGEWTPEINNMATTTYTFTPTSGECVTTATVTITIGEETTPTFPGIVTAYCAGTSFTLPTISYKGIEDE